jgi:hypothetical protein
MADAFYLVGAMSFYLPKRYAPCSAFDSSAKSHPPW